jgi:hypothetical protein
MNCEDSSRNFISAHKLICTVYSPKTPGEQTVNNSKTSIKSRLLPTYNHGLFTGKLRKKSSGEQVAEKTF